MGVGHCQPDILIRHLPGFFNCTLFILYLQKLVVLIWTLYLIFSVGYCQPDILIMHVLGFYHCTLFILYMQKLIALMNLKVILFICNESFRLITSNVEWCSCSCELYWSIQLAWYWVLYNLLCVAGAFSSCLQSL